MFYKSNNIYYVIYISNLTFFIYLFIINNSFSFITNSNHQLSIRLKNNNILIFTDTKMLIYDPTFKIEINETSLIINNHYNNKIAQFPDKYGGYIIFFTLDYQYIISQNGEYLQTSSNPLNKQPEFHSILPYKNIENKYYYFSIYYDQKNIYFKKYYYNSFSNIIKLESSYQKSLNNATNEYLSCELIKNLTEI